jgi:hypothetical protein
MMYRDDALAAYARVRLLRAEIASLRGRPETAEGNRLRAALRRRRRQVARARRGVARLRHRVWRALPRSVVELAVALWFTGGLITLTMGAAFIVACVLSLAHHG